MARTDISITIEDRDWPRLKLIVKEGQRVETESATYDVANTKFQGIINNFVSRSVQSQIQRKKQNV